jgi:hypothetical protein
MGLKDSEGDSTIESNRSMGHIKNKNLRNLLGHQSPFKPRGLPMATRMQVIEVSQMEDAKGREEINRTIEGLRTNNKLLLLNREKHIYLAKIISPVYQKDDPHWKKVLELSGLIDKNWATLQEKEKARDEYLLIDSHCSKIASKFASSMSEGYSMGTSLESSERDDSVVIAIEKADKVKIKRPYVRHASEFRLEVDSGEDNEVYNLKPAAVTQLESDLKEDSDNNEDSHDVGFVSF